MNNILKVLCADGFSKSGLNVLSFYENIKVTVNEKTSREDLLNIICDFDVLIVRSTTKVDKEVIDRGKNLKIVARAGVGLDTIDVDYCTRKGIVVINSPTGNVVSTAEHAISLMFSLARKIPWAHISTSQGNWDRKSFRGVELFRKKIGVIGLGKIGSEVAKRCLALGMEVMVYDPYLTEERAAMLGVKLYSLDEIYRKADFITFHVPLTDTTRNMVTKKEIEMMKTSVRIINCARGGIINEQDLADALNSERIAGAAIDVFSKEPPENNPLLKAKNCIVVPHLGASTEEAQENVSIEIGESIVKFFKENIIINSVNMPSVSIQKYKDLRSYIETGDKVGSFLSNIIEGRIIQINISYCGKVAEEPTQIITRAIVKGFMKSIAGEDTINYVNSLLFLGTHGIRLTESKEEDHFSVFSNLVKITVVTRTTKNEVWFSIYPNEDGKIVKIDNYYMELDLVPYMVLIKNVDKPGIVGFIGTILGQSGINIAEMKLNREKKGEKALTVISVDALPSEEVVNRLMENKDILDVKIVKI